MQTEQERLDSINKELSIKYTSLDEVDWKYISMGPTLSEDYIREFQDKVDWDCISQKQTLSKEFLREFKDMIAWDIFLCREDMRDILIDKMIN